MENLIDFFYFKPSNFILSFVEKGVNKDGKIK